MESRIPRLEKHPPFQGSHFIVHCRFRKRRISCGSALGSFLQIERCLLSTREAAPCDGSERNIQHGHGDDRTAPLLRLPKATACLCYEFTALLIELRSITLNGMIDARNGMIDARPRLHHRIEYRRRRAVL